MIRTLLRRVFRGNPKMLTAGTPAPKFTLRAHDGSEISLDDYAGRRVVLWFYPMADTPG
jgi:peroxiredoxin Q/BCP